MTVSDILLEGREIAMPWHESFDLLGPSNGRELTQMTERERRSDIPICASIDMNGPSYYLALDASEQKAYICSLARRLHNVSLTRKHLETSLLRMTDQDQLEGY